MQDDADMVKINRAGDVETSRSTNQEGGVLASTWMLKRTSRVVGASDYV